MSIKLPGRLWDAVGAKILFINNKNYLCTVDNYSKFLVTVQIEGFNTDDLIKHARLYFQNME